MQFAVRTPQQLRRPTEMKVRLSRVSDGPTAVMWLEGVYGLGFLGLGHVGDDNSCGEGCDPIREIRTDVLEMDLYRGMPRPLQLGRYAAYWQTRSVFSAIADRWSGGSRDGNGCAPNCEPMPAHPTGYPSRVPSKCDVVRRGAKERCCGRAEPMAALTAHALL